MPRYLFSRQGLALLQPYLGIDTLLTFDFDGTLAPIVMNPDQAALPKTSATLLRRLSKKFPVALISGRRLSDLRSRAPFKLVAWIGNHGMEGLPSNREKAKTVARKVKKWEESLSESLADFSDVKVENKQYSLTLHYRGSSQPASRKKLLANLAKNLKPKALVLPGKCVLNILAPGQLNKGDALKLLLKNKKYSRAIFVGDDDTDEDVFRLRDPRVFSIRIGANRRSAASVYLHDQEEMETLLRLLHDRTEKRP